ncbi:hypothetical protein DI09_1p520 [Mitosporidium daphniae]|uniref:Uncharacterized protein n=1 Tax=Mitosporidium daphniae TaxID=1485682 RepID=A0A098VT79_9MICR|nr:uncharacterized protein DI09_1p520 [Mitosporidium daphniae]KGG52202.1 hypothetical protein DI09_1p520 [Mitosporidium daphniae]|eukprot:XP_013238629.1 uncharacterized protein DI09_1p520 [Mitosporidium daphniae]
MRALPALRLNANLITLSSPRYGIRTGPQRIAPRFPGDSPFKRGTAFGPQGNIPGGVNSTKLLRKRLWLAVAGASALLIGGVILPNLEKAPITQRWRLMLVNTQQEATLGSMTAESLCRQNASLLLPPNDPSVVLVHRVTRRILLAALTVFPELFPPNASFEAVLKSFPIRVIKSSMVNASVLPGTF